MAKQGTRARAQARTRDGKAPAKVDGLPPRGSLGEFIDARVASLLGRIEVDECDSLHRDVIEEVESALLKAVIRATNENQGRAARALGISRGTLRKKLRAYGIGPAAPGRHGR